MSDKLVLPGGPITVDTFTGKDGRRVLLITEGAVKPNNRPAPGPKANTLGQVTPQTEPNRSGSTSKPPVKPEQAPEKGFLEGMKEGIDDFIDKSVENAGFSQPAMVLGAVGKALNEVFMPTAAWELIPVGKGAKILKKGGEAVGVVKKSDKAADGAKAAKASENASGGGHVDGPKKRSPRKPNREKWEKEGGTVQDHPDGSTTYTRKDGASVTYNKEGYPDFSKDSVAEVKIDGLKGQYGPDH